MVNGRETQCFTAVAYFAPVRIDKTRTPDDLFEQLPESERITAVILRALIFETLPDAREKLSWGAPFYFHRISFAYLWPASIPWGKMESGVGLGFPRAQLLDHGGQLLVPQGKSLARRVYHAPEDIDPEWVTFVLRQAWDNAA